MAIQNTIATIHAELNARTTIWRNRFGGPVLKEEDHNRSVTNMDETVPSQGDAPVPDPLGSLGQAQGVGLPEKALGAISCRSILGQRVDATSYSDATSRILGWALGKESRFVCVSTVHMVMEGVDDASYQKIVNSADLVTPDGMPLVWALKLLGVSDATRVYGPDLTLVVCEAAASEGIPIALYGGTPESLEDFSKFLELRYAGIKIACRIAPPFRPLNDSEDAEYTRQIDQSGARILFVGIGCPKQEKWMHAHVDRLSLPMIGVGAAFDFHSGRVRQSPQFLQRAGLEWLFRLAMEPRRLWKRYLKHNPRFIWRFIKQLWRARLPARG